MRFLIFLLLVSLSLVFLLNQSIKNQKNVFEPKEIINFKEKQIIRVIGTVKNLDIVNLEDKSFRIEFDLTDDSGASVRTLFYGYKPELLRDGIKAMVDGDWSGGVLNASSVLTQCPSKYEPKE